MRGKYGEKSEYIPGPGQYEYKSHIQIKEKGHDVWILLLNIINW